MRSGLRGRLVPLTGLLLAAALRLYGIRYAPTAARARPDEEASIIRGFFLFDDLDHVGETLSTGWPEGLYRAAGMVERAEAAVLGAISRRQINLACLYALDPGAVTVPLRALSVLADLGTCLLVAAMVRMLSRPKYPAMASTAGILAAGCNYLLIRDAHFAMSDASLTFLCTLCLLVSVQAARDGPARLPAAAAVLGLGLGVKYSAVAMVGTCLAGAAVSPTTRWTRWLGFFLLSMVVAVVVFIMVSPGVLTHPHELANGLFSHSSRYDNRARDYLLDPDYRIPPAWLFYPATVLRAAFGAPGLALSVCGLVLCSVTSPRSAVGMSGQQLKLSAAATV